MSLPALREVAADAVVRHPRHVLLGAVVLGLLAGPWVPATAVLVLAVAAGALAYGAGARDGVVLGAALLVLVAAFGGALRARVLDHTQLTPLFGHVTTGAVTITQAPRPQAFGGWSAQARFRGEPVLLRQNAPRRFGEAATAPAPAGVADPLRGAPGIGVIVRVKAAVRPPDKAARGVHAHAVLRALALTRTGRRRGGAAGLVDAIRRRAETALARGPDGTRAALLQGMVLGQDARLPTEARDDVRASGLSHLTAASGANIVLLATLVLALAALTGVPFRARWLVVLGLIALYVPLAGGGPSIQRAGVMGAAGVVAVLAGRPSARWYALGLAAVATLALDPRAAADPGWQMSFAAVLALVLLARPWAERLQRRRLPRPVSEALAVTAAATLATAPVIAAHFGQVAPLSLPANLVVAPAIAPIMWLGFVAALVGPVLPPAAQFLDHVADPLLRWVLAVAHATGSGGRGAVDVPGGAVVVLVVCGCVAVAAGAGRTPRVRLPGDRRRIALAAPALTVAAAALLGAWALRPGPPPPPPPVAALRVWFLDVGQGDATLLQVPGHAILVDTGPPDGGIVPRLRAVGVRRLDALVVTHAQADHDGGAAAVLAAFPVGLVLDGRDGVRSPLGDAFGAAARARRVRTAPGRAGAVLRAGGLALRILSPGEGPTSGASGADPNQRAIVAEASAAGASVLLTADAESDVLAPLDLGRVDVLKVSHHGSADPGLPALLERLQPLVAGIEVGAHNTYGHPAPTTLAALRTVPRTVRTDRDGSVRVDLAGGRWTVTPQRTAAGRG